ncbi:hypothetical protein [Streptomyces acidiscabies]|uniref:Uncharacterized protein n=1 Tax=Streptomyces acidiscabies TaxID=42234 RepID=A0AAP6ELF8_9ACTN|nr:hypothetical protein [Streptomyces acidiscabies]MBP5936708.1 hypothetical protein [Streptomyces sp. LBUM 1476]MBZ3915293.1 hypothetical protein [Streptomyces acidiscabies]MDX2967262.1 hypothetical protein [Streptomyces acidiscabies]MDX3026064.1 hypothetical protein [Streptomyces acidiscabies]MDX3797039.1 hypothetical protein [Streptomyces acidiscabies]
MNLDHDNGARLRAYATAVDGHTARLPNLDDPVRPPDFTQLTGQFADLTRTTRELTDLVLRLDATSSFDRHPMELWRLTRATAALATGTGNVGRALSELAFLTDTHPHRNQPDTADARTASRGVFEDALAEARIDLREGSTDLHRLANDLDPPLITAALARTTTTSLTPSGFDRSPAATPPPVPRTARSL